MGDITQVLQGWSVDRDLAAEQLTPLVYEELHKIAAAYVRNARPDHTLQPTALIHEAYMRMIQQERALPSDRKHFFALAATIMRRVLVDFARARFALEMERAVCLTDPPAPGLGSELDDILLMALRKEPERRYRDVQEMARDVERFQQGLPVSATPDTFGYRVSKFIGRNRLALAAVLLVIVSLAVGLGAAIYQKRRADNQRRLAETRFNDVRSLAMIRFPFLFPMCC